MVNRLPSSRIFQTDLVNKPPELEIMLITECKLFYQILSKHKWSYLRKVKKHEYTIHNFRRSRTIINNKSLL